MLLKKYEPVVAILIALAAYAVNGFYDAMPRVKPADVPEVEFSADRAMGILEYLLQDGVPHPVGSEANRRVEKKIVDWLDGHGIRTGIQSSWGCSSQRNHCAWTRNVLGLIPGEESKSAVLLMAHYDSVPAAAGAGDDGAGVAAVLETGRILRNEGPLHNPLILLLTDAEEVGLLGAEAFFSHHPLKDQIGVVVNLEGSGSTGHSRLLRTAGGGRSLMAAYADHVRYHTGTSLVEEIFERMPNDTDFSVSRRVGIPGIDFAFAGERNHYHTRNDSLQNLDRRSLQHHGENILPLARALATMDLEELKGEDVVYHGGYGFWVYWQTGFNAVLLATSFIVLVVASRLLRPNFLRAGAGFLSAPVVLTGTGLLLFVFFRLIHIVNGTTVSWPAHPWPWRMVLFSSGVLACLLVALPLNRRVGREEGLIGLWWFWWFLSLLSVVFLPKAANLLLLPTLVSSVLLALSSVTKGNTRIILFMATLVPVVPMTLSFVLTLEETQGYGLIMATFFSLGMFMASLMPFVRGVTVRPALYGFFLIAAGGGAGAVAMPLYSDWRPQHLNLQLIVDSDAGLAWWRVSSPNPVPDRLRSVMGPVEEVRVYPWQADPVTQVSPAGGIQVDPPYLHMVDVDDGTDGASVSLVMGSNRNANHLVLVVPSGHVTGFSLDGARHDWAASNSPDGQDRLILSGIRGREVHLVLHLESRIPDEVYLLDVSSELPDGAEALLEARSPLAVPVHQGDSFQVFRRFSLQDSR